MKIAVIGGGSWGTALARLLSRKGHDISLWVHEKEVLESIRSTRENKIYLPEVTLPEALHVSTNIEEVLTGAKWVLFVVPSHVSRGVLTQMSPHLTPHIPIISATKGIEQKSLMLISEVIQEVTQRDNTDRIAVLSGPSFAKEIVLEHPTAVSLAATDARLAARIQTAFSTRFFKLFFSPDLTGVQLGGALKNVIALAAGGSDGLGFGYNTKAVLMSCGLSEIARLGVAMGADSKTFYGLSGIGDLFLTCSGAHSRNRSVGQQMGNGVPLDEIQKKMKMVAEGIYTTESAFALSKKHQIEMPIVREIYHVLFKGKSPREAVNDLMEMARGDEFSC